MEGSKISQFNRLRLFANQIVEEATAYRDQATWRTKKSAAEVLRVTQLLCSLVNEIEPLEAEQQSL